MYQFYYKMQKDIKIDNLKDNIISHLNSCFLGMCLVQVTPQKTITPRVVRNSKLENLRWL